MSDRPVARQALDLAAICIGSRSVPALRPNLRVWVIQAAADTTNPSSGIRRAEGVDELRS